MNFLRSFDWLTLIVYVILVLMGWVTINAASYNFDGASIFDFSRPSGKQIVWFALAIFLIIAILCLDSRFYMTYAPVIYVAVMLLLFVTIFAGTNINGSHSWIKIGSFSIQPAEFGKFSTALMIAYLFNGYNFKFTEPANFLKACAIILVPVILIILQNETGSALVYFSLILLFYRQGMSGIVLWAGFCFILIFVLGIKYSVEPLPEGVVLGPNDSAPASLKGQNLVLTIVPFLVAGMLAFFADNVNAAGLITMVSVIGFGVFGLLDHFVTWPFPFQYRWIGWIINAFTIGYCFFLYLVHKTKSHLIVGIFAILFVGFLYTCDFAFNKLQPHQRGRIEVLLGMKEDLKGAGYNVNQAKIAIGSGGLFGKGYLEGTQTKLAYVPEQETDFIFCTVGEEQGFVGCVFVLFLYFVLISRLIVLAERQRTVFAQVYGYCVACIFAFHVIINVGMVIGLVPVIGIPLPFFSYGGSGLWSFTILLFIFLKLDATRIQKY
jgi:rod shape determining protein RodA